ncbi:winged helix-turn-helix domain-containing protein [Mesorhizobium sp.]|uniref:winged helix-turn-helix domain-containing protein n=1 Tax=Mesorhizobium sp. TaxID=1871066 RepID=UPI0025F30879|nr:winged helix-turn-helix domain-containing protein [Mesorhizobium sp.]
MRVLILASSANPKHDAAAAETVYYQACTGGFEAEKFDNTQDICSALYRDPDTMAVIWTDSPGIASVICRNWRQANITNILFVLLVRKPRSETLTDAAVFRCNILAAGADDVQPAPIDKDEFAARLAALARRDRRTNERLVKLPCDAVFDPNGGTVKHPGGTILLTKLEGDVLELLSLRGATIVTKEMVMNYLYGGRDEANIKIVDVAVCKIRKKLAVALNGLDVIQTVWGRGYQFVPGGYTPVMTEAHARVAG